MHLSRSRVSGSSLLPASGAGHYHRFGNIADYWILTLFILFRKEIAESIFERPTDAADLLNRRAKAVGKVNFDPGCTSTHSGWGINKVQSPIL